MPQHDDLSLAPGQRPDRPPQLVAVLPGPGRGGSDVNPIESGPLPAPRSAGLVDLCVDDDPPGVRLDPALAIEAGPRHVEPGQRGLHEVISASGIAADEDRGPHEPVPVSGDERAEGLVASAPAHTLLSTLALRNRSAIGWSAVRTDPMACSSQMPTGDPTMADQCLVAPPTALSERISTTREPRQLVRPPARGARGAASKGPLLS